MTTFVQDYRPIFLVVTFGLLGSAFYLTYRPRKTAATGGDKGSRPPASPRANIMTLNKVMLWAVTVIVIVFLFFPQAVTGLFASQDGFTADMDRTVITIEGMT